jgi:DNA-binding response OmpR family regulator
VADDEEGIRVLIATALRRHAPEAEVLTAVDGEQALVLAARERPDLLFLDVVMPKMNGWDVCATLKATGLGQQTKVVMISALGNESHIQQALASGADEYLTKPFSLARIRELLVELGW